MLSVAWRPNSAAPFCGIGWFDLINLITYVPRFAWAGLDLSPGGLQLISPHEKNSWTSEWVGLTRDEREVSTF